MVAGPYWYEGPDFQKKHEIYPAEAFDPHGYSNNFLTFTGDFNGDGWLDVLYVPHPGHRRLLVREPRPLGRAVEEAPGRARLRQRVAGLGRYQRRRPPGTGLQHQPGQLGYATWDPAKPNDLWVFHPITPKDGRYQRYTHGVGVGDINGDGRLDIVEASGWWEQPAKLEPGKPWIKHPFKFAEAGRRCSSTTSTATAWPT